MVNRPNLTAIAVLAFGALVLNAMPAWVAELARVQRLSDQAAGGAASVMPLAAAVVCALARPGARAVAGLVPALLAPLCLAALTLPSPLGFVGVAATCMVLGASLGAMTERALSAVAAGGGVQDGVARATALGLFLALGLYPGAATVAMPVLPVLAAVAGLVVLRLLAVPFAPVTDRAAPLSLGDIPYLQIPFFLTMGAFWAYLELYATGLAGSAPFALWLLGSLVTGMAGSAVAMRVGPSAAPRVAAAALALAALTGALSYISPSRLLLGLNVLANGFFLFLYFPLYLSNCGSSDGADAPSRMAFYLFGFAGGGALGAGLLAIAGYGGLAAAIALAGGIGLMRPPARPVV